MSEQNSAAEIFGLELDSNAQETREDFRIDDKSKASWAMRKVAYKQKQKDENMAVAKAEVEKIQLWLDGENKRLDMDINFFTGKLGEYMRYLNKQDERIKTMNLPEGSMKLRILLPEIIVDKDQLLEWLTKTKKEYYINEKTVRTANWADLKNDCDIVDESLVLKETGEVIPDVVVEEREPKFSVKVQK